VEHDDVSLLNLRTQLEHHDGQVEIKLRQSVEHDVEHAGRKSQPKPWDPNEGLDLDDDDDDEDIDEADPNKLVDPAFGKYTHNGKCKKIFKKKGRDSCWENGLNSRCTYEDKEGRHSGFCVLLRPNFRSPTAGWYCCKNQWEGRDPDPTYNNDY